MEPLAKLGRALRDAGYAFITPTPASHQRILARGGQARTLPDVFGWSRPFPPQLLPETQLALLEEAGALVRARELRAERGGRARLRERRALGRQRSRRPGDRESPLSRGRRRPHLPRRGRRPGDRSVRPDRPRGAGPAADGRPPAPLYGNAGDRRRACPLAAARAALARPPPRLPRAGPGRLR